jgi:hypothetical protein
LSEFSKCKLEFFNFVLIAQYSVDYLDFYQAASQVILKQMVKVVEIEELVHQLLLKFLYLLYFKEETL